MYTFWYNIATTFCDISVLKFYFVTQEIYIWYAIQIEYHIFCGVSERAGFPEPLN